MKEMLLSCVTILAAGTAMGASVAFDLRPTRKLMKAAVAPTGEPTGILRTTSLAAGKTLTGPLAVGDELSFALFDDVTVTLSLAERTEAPLGGETFLAEVSGYDGMKNAVVMQTSDGLQVDVQDFRKNRVYSIVSTAKGTSVREFDPQAGKVVPTRPLVPELSKADSPPTAQSPVMASSQSTDQASTLVDVLVAFDRNAVTYAEKSEGGMDNFANMAVAKMNTALANNGMSSFFRFRLVGTMAVDASATDVHTGLYAIRDSQAGWAAIKAKREEVGADIVTTLIDTGSAYGTTGVGWSLTDSSRIAAFADSAYNVCAIRSVAQSHTMTHETGHNMGAGHATAVADVGNRGPQLFGYSSGHYFTGSDGRAYHTIMAYDSDGYGNSYTEAPLFSSPDCMWAGTVAGDATHDNAKTIRNTYQYASDWRAQKIAMSYDVFFSPETETLFADSVTVTLTPGKAGLPIRYTVDGSTPTLSSPLYSVPLVLKTTTTVKAATVTEGVLGPVYEARYLKSDLGTALNAPQLNWTTSPDYPWNTQKDNTFDGFAVQSCPQFVGDSGCGKTSWLKTTVTGPTEMGFRYQKRQYSSSFKVYCDNQVVWSDSEEGYDVGASAWTLAMVSLPSGTHEVKFAFEQGNGYYKDFNGIVLDTVCFDAWSSPPTISPETTAFQSTATTFTGSLTIALTPPEGRTGTLFYTLDGSDPSQDGALLYEGPFTVDKSVFVQAVFVESGRETSPPARGYFLERHPVRPGEWTTDVEGAKAAAAEDGKLIAVLCANRGGCWWTQQFMPIAESPEFLAWAAANGVYLITSDDSELIDTEAADDYFWSLWGGGSVYYPTLVFARPSAPETLLSWGRARNDGDSTIGGVLYEDTIDSLVRGFAAVLGQTSVLSAPTVSPDSELVDSFPLTVKLTNPNATGTIYYTLDGSVPTKANGRQYSSAISIASSDIVLKAAVWNPSGLSSPVLVKSYKTITDVVGTTGVTWSNESTVKWREEPPGQMRVGGLNSTYTSTLSARVSGKGKFVFTYRFNSWTRQNTFEFSINGSSQFKKSYNGSTSFSETVAKEITADGETTFAWTYAVADSTRDYGSGYASQAGIWLYDVRWIPGLETPKGVPYSWLDEQFPTFVAHTPEDYAELEDEDADGDGYSNFEEYLCGTDPNSASTEESGVPQCFIRMDGSLPVVTHNIVVPDAAQAEGWSVRIVGSTDFRSWSAADMTVHRFFRAVVEKTPADDFGATGVACGEQKEAKDEK